MLYNGVLLTVIYYRNEKSGVKRGTDFETEITNRGNGNNYSRKLALRLSGHRVC